LIVGSRDKQQHGVGKKTKKLKKVVGVKWRLDCWIS
jgi:hypothetical protein